MVTQFHAIIQVLRSDNGGEFLNHDLNQFLPDHGIIHQRPCLTLLKKMGGRKKEQTLIGSRRHSASKLLVASGKQPVAPFSSSTTENLLQNDRSLTDSDRSPTDSDWSPEENFQLSPRCQNQEEEIEPVYEILPASAPVRHQSPTEEVIQKAQSLHISLQKGRTVANLELSESRVHYVKQLADISVPNSVTKALEDPKWKEAMNEEMELSKRMSHGNSCPYLMERRQ
ncbi:hypothetical protein Prudu_018782 [Prunus dulcis]|uniref:Integrase catalytic domain-containing protein n=1 Tax=Prunus dulcis TaxID=3755 RepID=A0A4Y1RRP7_PRUDU|nr:hypothetical protein Prudu_018782 [Prunus dulcis]